MNNLEIVKNLCPQDVFKYFALFSSIPHGSKNTNKAVVFLINFSKENNLLFFTDDYNNIIIVKKSKSKNKSSIALQAHIDMVCVKDDISHKDFKNEGIDFVLNDNQLTAKDTSLGADDGIGVSIILSLLSSSTDYERDLYAIFTNDEEIGMDGSRNIDLSNIDAESLINIDSEDFGIITVGCAGGIHTEYKKSFDIKNVNNKEVHTIKIKNCLGGHSGVMITENRANAIKLIATLMKIITKEKNFNLININGGTFDNAIPTDCEISFISDEITKEFIKNKIESFKKYISNEYPNEKNIVISFDSENENNFSIFNCNDSKNIIDMFLLLPTGLIKLHKDFNNIAQTSLNLGIVKTYQNEINFTYLIRSNVNKEKEDLFNEVDYISKEYGFDVINNSSYPAWEYENNYLLDFSKNIFNALFNEEPKIEITHGGLECGILLNKLKTKNAISIGPTIKYAHTTKECLLIDTVKKTYDFLDKLLTDL